MHEILDGHNTTFVDDDEAGMFLHSHSPNRSDRKVDSSNWWESNAGRFPSDAKAAWNVLAVKAKIVARESLVSTAENMTDNTKCSLFDATIRVCMCLASWHRSFGSNK